MRKLQNHNQLMNEQPPPIRAIANLAAALELFEPVFVVNDSPAQLESEKEWTGEFAPKDPHKPYPNFHQLLNTCYAAMGDIKEFIKQHELMRSNYTSVIGEVMAIKNLLAAEGLSQLSLSQGVEVLLSQKHQCFDFIDKLDTEIASIQTSEVQIVFVHELIKKFKSRYRKIKQNPVVEIPLVNAHLAEQRGKVQGERPSNILPFNGDLGTQPPDA